MSLLSRTAPEKSMAEVLSPESANVLVVDRCSHVLRQSFNSRQLVLAVGKCTTRVALHHLIPLLVELQTVKGKFEVSSDAEMVWKPCCWRLKSVLLLLDLVSIVTIVDGVRKLEDDGASCEI